MYSKRELIALIIWWCEGTKARKDKRWKNSVNKAVEVTNTDPKIIKLFTEFLIKDLKVDVSKLRAQVQIHEGDNQIKIEEYWSNISNIPISQFNKTIIRPVGNKIGKNFGTFKIRTYDKILFDSLTDKLNKEITKLFIIGE